MKTLHTWDTEYSADSVEWCPITPYYHLFVCGTYQLQDVPDGTTDSSQVQKKVGRLYLFSISLTADLIHLLSLEMSAILDIKWCHQRVNNRVLLGVANAEGDLLIYELEETNLSDCDDSVDETTRYKLSLLTKFNLCEEDGTGPLALSLDWSTGKFEDSEPCVVVSDSHGVIHLLRLTDSVLISIRSWKAHSFEAWITAFDYWNTSIIYSGGDDCKMFVFDSRSDSAILTSRAHEMGVTSMHCNAAFENLMITGSYDEKLRTWDTRSMKQPLNTTALLGGIWRVKWDPHHWQLILAACMYGGFCIVDCPADSQCPNIVMEYKEHGSLAYGSDWCHMPSTEVKEILQQSSLNLKTIDDMYLVGTCSFYDHKMCISAFNTSK